MNALLRRYSLTMPASRLSRETSKYFNNSAASTPPTAPPRSTRSSIARFAYTATPSTAKEDDDSSSLSELSFNSDIEDAVKGPLRSTARANGTSSTTTLKRKRATTTTTTTPTSSPRKTKIKLETDLELDFTTLPSSGTPPKPRRAARKPARRVTSPTTGRTTVEPPSDWEEMYRLVKEMRVSGPASNAAVDTMGCERLAGRDASPRDKRFHTLVALMLSSQTKDTVTAEAMARLMREMPAAPAAAGSVPGLNLENMLAVDPGRLNEMIGKVGFHNNKTKYVAPPRHLYAS